MNAADHLAQAEAGLLNVPDPEQPGYNMVDLAISVNALANALIAVAIELGVPHGNAPTAGGSGG